MSATHATHAPGPAISDLVPVREKGTLKVSQIRVLRSEWTKFRSLRSTLWTLLVSVLLTVGIGALFSAVSASQFDKLNPAQKGTFDPISTSLGGVTFAQLAIGVLGVLLITGEYSTGMIRSSLTAVPRRLPVLWGKLLVFAGVVLVVSLITTLGSFLLGQTLLNGHDLGVSLSADGALKAVIGASLYLTVAGLIALGLGSLMRNTAGAISTFVAVFFVLPPLTQLLPSSWTSHFVQYLPSNAGGALFGSTNGVTDPLTFGSGLAVICGYAVIVIGAAAWWLRHSDA